MKRTVYIVEDHPDMLRTYEYFIGRMEDLEVVGLAESAEEALEDEVINEAELALVDVSLPGMSGIDLVAVLRERRPGLPCLIVSGHSEDVYAESAHEAGARGYVMKGDPFKIVKAIRKVLEGETCFSSRVRRRLSL